MSTSAPLPSFDRAEFHGDPPLPDRCAYCHHNIETQYFRVDGNLACPSCAQQAQSLIPPDSHKAYSRAVVFGIGAAIAACIGYALIQLTGYMIGFVAIGVGWLVGTAMKKGSRGLGGRRYQITAALLTYIAISMAFIPILYKAVNQYRTSHPVTAVQSSSQSSTASPPGAPVTPEKTPTFSIGKFFLGILLVFVLGLISPVLKFFFSVGSGLFGLLFLFIGIQTAWKLTQRVASEVEGPFEQA